MKTKFGDGLERLGIPLTMYAAGCTAPVWLRGNSWMVIAIFVAGCVFTLVGATLKPKSPA